MQSEAQLRLDKNVNDTDPDARPTTSTRIVARCVFPIRDWRQCRCRLLAGAYLVFDWSSRIRNLVQTRSEGIGQSG